MKIELEESVALALWNALSKAICENKPQIPAYFTPVTPEPVNAGLPFLSVTDQPWPIDLKSEPAKFLASPEQPAIPLDLYKAEYPGPLAAEPEPQPTNPTVKAEDSTINDKQWSAILNAGISHGLTIDKVSSQIREFFGVDAIKELRQSQFQDALDLVSGKPVSGERPVFVKAAEKAAADSKITNSQWTKILNAGCYNDLGVDGTEALVKEKYGVRIRDLTADKFDEVLEFVRMYATV